MKENVLKYIYPDFGLTSLIALSSQMLERYLLEACPLAEWCVRPDHGGPVTRSFALAYALSKPPVVRAQV